MERNIKVLRSLLLLCVSQRKCAAISSCVRYLPQTISLVYVLKKKSVELNAVDCALRATALDLMYLNVFTTIINDKLSVLHRVCFSERMKRQHFTTLDVL